MLRRIADFVDRIPSAVWRRILSRPAAFVFRKFRGVEFEGPPLIIGCPVFRGDGAIKFGTDSVLVSSTLGNPLGLTRRCIFGTLSTEGSSGFIQIGSRFSASGVCIWAQKSVTIGNDVMVGANATIVDTDFHSMDATRRNVGHLAANSASVVIDDDVWIGMNVVILKGVTIGRGAIIGANCVVTKDVPPGGILVSASNRLLQSHEQVKGNT